MMLSLDTAYRSFGGEVEASSTPMICRLPDSRRHQLSAIAPSGDDLLFRDWLFISPRPSRLDRLNYQVRKNKRVNQYGRTVRQNTLVAGKRSTNRYLTVNRSRGSV